MDSELVTIIGIVVVGFILSVAANWATKPGWAKNGTIVVIVVLSMSALVFVTVIKENLDDAKTPASAGDVGRDRISTTTTTSEQTVVTTTERESPTSTTTSQQNDRADETTVEPTTVTALNPQIRYLTDIEPIGGYGNFQSEGVAQLGGATLSESIIFSPGVFNKNLKDLTFNVPTDLGWFRATVGLRDDTLPGYVAHIDVKRRDGSTVASLTIRPGEVHEIRESVAGAGAITVKVAILEWDPNAVNSRPRIVVGDGRFVLDD